MNLDWTLILGCLFLSFGFFEDLKLAQKNNLQLTCLTRRFSIIYFLFHLFSFLNYNKQEEFLNQFLCLLFLIVLKLQSLGFQKPVVLTPFLVLSPFVIFVFFFRNGWMEVANALEVLILLHFIVVCGFWIGIFLDPLNDSSKMIWTLFARPWILLCDVRYFTILCDHGIYNVFVLFHIFQNYFWKLTFACWPTVLWYLGFYLLYVSCVVFSYHTKKKQAQKSFRIFHRFLVSSPPLLSRLRKSDSECEASFCFSFLKKQEASFQDIMDFEADLKPFFQCLDFLSNFYALPECQQSSLSLLDQERVKGMLWRGGFTKAEIHYFLNLLEIREKSGSKALLGSLALAQKKEEREKIVSFLESCEYLFSTFPYDVLYPSFLIKEQELQEKGKKRKTIDWSFCFLIVVWTFNLGLFWFLFLNKMNNYLWR